MAVSVRLIVVFQVCLLVFCEGNEDRLIVTTRAGLVRGSSRELNGTMYRVFAGVPYAEPPVGSFRFSPPVDKIPWERSTVLNTTSYGSPCLQNAVTLSDILPTYLVELSNRPLDISEDCLTLNVYTPYPSDMTTDWAVMVWLHGGSYRYGKGSAYDASALSLKGGIIVVTINYRLGPFGFLYTGDESAPGNLGLMDQQLALRWVRNNIRAFGGDPSRVTLAGQAGVHGSASLHMFAKESRPLFHRVAAHSGVFRLDDLQESAEAMSTSKALAELADCPVDSNDTLISCLRAKTPTEILSYNLQLSDEMKSSYLWRPVFTPDFFTTQPRGSMKFNLLSLVNTGDGSIALELLKDLFPNAQPDVTSEVTENQWREWFDSYTDTSELTDKAVAYEYIDTAARHENVARLIALVNAQSDRDYSIHGTSALRDLQSILSSTHVMVFDHRSSSDPRFSELDLAPHGSELPYLFGIPFDESRGLGNRFTDDERKLSYQLMRLWSNFVKTGNPNGNEMEGNPLGTDRTWPEFGTAEEHLKIQLEETEVDEAYRRDGVYFWGNYLPKLRDAAAKFCPILPPMSTPKEECEEPFIGEGLGLVINRQQAEQLIEGFIYACIAIICLGLILLGVACGYRSRAIMILKANPDVERGSGKTDGSRNVSKALLDDDTDGAGTSGTSSPDADSPNNKTMPHSNDIPVYAFAIKRHENKDKDPPPDIKIDYVSDHGNDHAYANVGFKPESDDEGELSVHHGPEQEDEEVDVDEIFPPPPADLENDVAEDAELPPPPTHDAEEDENGYHGYYPVVDPPDNELNPSESEDDPAVEPAAADDTDSSTEVEGQRM